MWPPPTAQHQANMRIFLKRATACQSTPYSFQLSFNLSCHRYLLEVVKHKLCLVMQEASDAHSKTADSDTVSTYQVSSVQLVTDKKLEAFNKA